MSTSQFDAFLRRAERHAVLTVMHAHPEWTLGDIMSHVERNGARSAAIRELTLGELMARTAIAASPSLKAARLAAALGASGPEFDEHVREVIAEAGGRAVAAAYLRERVGGPRWKLQSSLGRLLNAGLITRSGTTSSTRYRPHNPNEPGK